jgi:lipoprotein-releasing system ATP-binding protein
MPLLQATGLTKQYHTPGQAATVVLRGAEFTCEPGEFVAVTGPSGAGKSTLLHILASLDLPDSGMVSLQVDGKHHQYQSLSARQLAALRNKAIGVVFQFHHLLPEFTALENVMMPVLISGSSQARARTQAQDMLRRVGLAAREDHAPSELSGGEQQRVAIARALVNQPSIVFADEPTGNLDSENAEGIAELLIDLQRQTGMACVVATHSNSLAEQAHRTVRMQDGICLS